VKARSGWRCRIDVLHVCAHDVRIVLARGAAKGFETDDQQHDADTGASEHTAAADVPLFGKKACLKVSWESKPRWCFHTYTSRWCSSSTASERDLSVGVRV